MNRLVTAVTVTGMLLSLCGCPAPLPTLEGLEVAIVPGEPGPDDDLTASVVVQADGHDADGFSYVYLWTADGAEVADLSERIVPADRTVGGELWEVTVTPTLDLVDEILTGPDATVFVTIAIDAIVDGDGDGFEGPDGDGSDCDDTDPDINPSAEEVCDEADTDCNGAVDDTEDLDGDGSFACDDCDETDPDVFPGNPEVCDGIDNDCVGGVDNGFPDVDGDGVGFCEDCDDNDAEAYPGNDEACETGGLDDQVDNDCNPANDTNGMLLYFPDNDADGVGGLTPEPFCGGRPDGYTELGGDCDDDDATIAPGEDEGCDGVDTDCDGSLGASEIDDDTDGQTECAGDCDDADPDNFTGNTEVCDGVDNDCDGFPEPDDVDGDGQSLCDGDCDDADPDNFVGNTEVCDDADNNCDTVVDDGLIFVDWFLDDDGDGEGAGVAVSTCDGAPTGPDAWVVEGSDCDDADPDNFPGNVEVCDDADNDCGGDVDEGFDVDGDSWTSCGGDCNDAEPDISPDAVEICDGLDNDCDGATSETVDIDGDGVAACDGDCDEDDPLVSPDADEDATNGIDDDCDGDVDEYTFTHIYTNVVQPNCFCHAGATHSTGFAYDNDKDTLYSVWVDAPASEPAPAMDRVEPGDSTASYVMHKLDGTQATVGGSGGQMPLSGCCLSDEVRDAIRAWIDEGAPDN